MKKTKNLHGDVQTDCVKQQGASLSETTTRGPKACKSKGRKNRNRTKAKAEATAVVDNMKTVEAVEANGQNGFNAREHVQKIIDNDIKPITITLIDNRISVKAGVYPAVAVEVNKLQSEKVIKWCFTGETQQVFPLSEEEVKKADPKDLQPAKNLAGESIYMIVMWSEHPKSVKVNVNPFHSNRNELDLRITVRKGVVLRFLLDKYSLVADMLRGKNVIY